VLVYDRECSFCRFWIDRWKSLTGERVHYVPFQEAAGEFPQIPLENFRRSVQLILPDGEVLSAAHAAFYTLTFAPDKTHCYRALLWLYRNITGVAFFAELFYRFVAGHRNFLYKVSRLLRGHRFVHPSYHLTRWLFLRCLGVIYLIAFVSLWAQLKGLIGQHGILPAANLLSAVSQHFGSEGYRLYPTLAWFNASDHVLGSLAAGGTLAALLVTLGIATAPCLIIVWTFYLSLVTVGSDFMSFQWDILLLEAGFLAIFFAPWKLLAPHWHRRKLRTERAEPQIEREHIAPTGSAKGPLPHVAGDGTPAESAPSMPILWVLRWLLFRLLFMSGAVKLLSSDPNWRNLCALDYDYYTQPLPTPVAWYMAQLPHGFQKLSVLIMFFIELCVPFLIIAPRRLRFAGVAMLAFLQVMIGITGNYTFFNLLTLVLCLLLLDDAFLRRWVPSRLAARIIPESRRESEQVSALESESKAEANNQAPLRPAVNNARAAARPITGRVVRVSVACLIFILSGALELERLSRGAVRFQPAMHLVNLCERLHIVNGYGLFAVMTTMRLEIIVQGSNDGQNWLDYEFKYKPGNLKRPPPWVEPHQPRLDWQMWFAALGSYENNPWFVNFMVRLLEGSPEVLSLLARNPFPNAPPNFVRAEVYDYHFTDFVTRKATGDWWQRELKGSYFPVVSLKAGGAKP